MFNNQIERGVAMRTKEDAQRELKEMFGMPKTSDFHEALRRGEIEKCETWLQYIIDYKENFPQYHATWDSWVRDRRREIDEVRLHPSQEVVPTRSKAEAQGYLEEKYGFCDTAGFRKCLAEGKLELAESWLAEIENNPAGFPQYLATRSSWLHDREKELEQYRK